MSNPQIAITGYAARLPGATTPDDVWSILSEGRCTVGPWDNTRWSQERFYHPDARAAGYTYAKRAGLLSDIWDFDKSAFGISAREATQMDPQQRVLLEVCAEAISAAGLTTKDWDRSRTGVYIGASSSDHAMSFSGDIGAVEEHFMLGNTLSIMSNRLSFHFDLTGPSYTVDTACSSSFYALDQARKAIEAGEVDTAIVGGVNVLLSPLPFVGFSRATMLSPDGLCKAFDADANGYVRSEGAVVFVLRRLDHAQKAQDKIRGILVGTGVNSDGRTIGMSLPNGDRQADLMRDVLNHTKVNPDDIAFVEAHGTGTAVGDPEEATAIGKVYGQARINPLPLGSAKSNFGHLEPVSGLVGLLKSQLALEHNVCPATLHVDALNPNIPFDDLNLDVATKPSDLARSAKPWHAAINSFGFGGANAHVIIRQPRQSELSKTPARTPKTNAIVLSAHSSELLETRAGQWAEHLDSLDGITAEQHINSANHRMEWQNHRVIVQANTVEDLTEGLASFAAGEAGPSVSTGRAIGKGQQLAFAFSGNGSQWDGMGRDQFVNNQTFRASFEATNAQFKDLGCDDLKQLLFSPTLGDALGMAPVAQPVLFAVQLATVDMMAEQGIEPCAVIGHSVGEVAAAAVAGALSRKDATTLVYRRSLALDQLRDMGTMAAVASDQDTLSELLDGFSGEVSLAGVNSPKSCTISGPTDAIGDFLRFARTRRIAGKKLDIPYPYHSHLVEPLKQTLLDDLAYLRPMASDIPIYSSTNGALVAGEDMDQDYWWRNARDAVLFSSAVAEMMETASPLVAEISAKPVLRTYLRDVAETAGLTQGYVATLDERRPAQRTADKIAAEALILGTDIDCSKLIGLPAPFSGDLPPVLWDHKTLRVPFERDRMDIFSTQPHHPLLGGRLRMNDTVWYAKIDTERLPWLKDHKVLGRVLFPATGYLEMCLAVGAAVLPDQAVEIDDLDIQRPIVLDGAKRLELRTIYAQQSHRVTIEYRPADSSQPWTIAAQAVLWPKVRAMDPVTPVADATPVDTTALYAGLTGLGYDYGPAFAKLSEVEITDDQASAVLGASDAINPLMRLDPTLADAALHAILAVLDRRNALSAENALRFLPTRIGRCMVGASLETPNKALINIKSLRTTSVVVDVTFSTDDGTLVAQIENLALAAVQVPSDAQVDARWHIARVPVGAPPAHSLLAKVWPDAAKALTRLELTAPEHPEPDDGALLLDAIAHRHAWDLIVENGVRPLTTTKKLRAASTALVTADAAQWDAEARRLELVQDCPWPELSLLCDAFVRTAPERAADLQTALRALNGEPRDTLLTPPDLWRAAQTALHELDQAVPASDLGARLLVLGRPDAAFVGALGVLQGFGAVTLAGAAQSDADALAASLSIPAEITVAALGEAAQTGSFDAIIAVDALGSLNRDALGALSASLVPSGLLLGFEQDPTPYDTLIAQDSGQTRAETDATAERLRSAGLGDVTTAPFSGNTLMATVLSARGLQDLTADQAAEKPLSVAVLGESDLALGLREALPDAGVIVKPVADTVIHIVSGTYDAPDTKGELTRLGRDFTELLDIKAKKLWIICDDSPASAAYSGFVRVMANERPDTAVTLIKNQTGIDATPQLAEIIALGTDEPELEVSAQGVAALRVQLSAPRKTDPDCDATALQLGQRRTLEDLTWTPIKRTEPATGEVEIEVHATGLNFRDVMWAQGLLPPEALEDGFAGATLGMECAGRIVRAPKDSAYLPGDPVIAFAPQAFASHITVGEAAVARMPDGVPLDQAAALPTAFFTAVYSLNEVARIREGEIVLIHGGAGGVGLAALQVAKAKGAKVFATAGSTWKRDLLRALGADAVFDSRSLAFADDVMRETGGRGVDVVLNSLAGLAMEQSIKCLAGFGRFIELGKKDYYANTPIGLRDLRRNIAYHGVDVDQLLAGRADIAADIMAQISHGFAADDYYLPPVEMFEPQDVHSAFRLMQKSGHIGKIVVRAPKPQVAQKAAPKPAPIRGAWLVIGGASGFGLQSANWLADHGAEALWLVSRSAAAPDTTFDIPVTVRKGDVTKPADMQEILDEIAASGVPLRGVLHAAMVLDDGLLADQTPERLSRVMTPKIAGAAVLDRLTRDANLDHFVLYSSVTTLFGNPGQAGYVAANRWLEALAEARRADGLPAQAIAWGPISDAGYLTRNDTLGETLKLQLGGEMLDSKGALKALGDVLSTHSARAVEVVAPIKWGRLAKDLKLVRSAMFNHVDTSGEVTGGAEALDVAEIVRSQGPVVAQKRVLDVLRIQAGEILRQPKAEVDPTKPLTEMGFDSLLAVSLRMTVEERFGLEIPQVAMTENLTLRDLARQMVAECGAEANGQGAHDADHIATIAKHVDAKGGLNAKALGDIEQAALEVKTLTGEKRK